MKSLSPFSISVILCATAVAATPAMLLGEKLDHKLAHATVLPPAGGTTVPSSQVVSARQG